MNLFEQFKYRTKVASAALNFLVERPAVDMLPWGIDGIGLARVVCVGLAQIAGRRGRSTRPFRFGFRPVSARC